MAGPPGRLRGRLPAVRRPLQRRKCRDGARGQRHWSVIAVRPEILLGRATNEFDRLAKSDPGNAGWQRDLSVSYEKIGDVLVAQGNLPEALKSYAAGCNADSDTDCNMVRLLFD
jgi:hypothetical protein